MFAENARGIMLMGSSGCGKTVRQGCDADARLQLGVERVGLGASLLQHLVEVGKGLGERAPGQAQTKARAALPEISTW